MSVAWRGTILFLAGLSLLIYEVVLYTGEIRWGLMPVYSWMMGMPVVMAKDAPSSAPPTVSSGPQSPTGEVTP